MQIHLGSSRAAHTPPKPANQAVFLSPTLPRTKPLDSPTVSSRQIHFTIFSLFHAMSLQNSWPRIMSSSNKRALPVDTEDSKQGLNHLKVRTLTVINKLTSKLIASLHQWVQKAYPRTPTTKALLLRPCALSMMEASAEHRSCPKHWQSSEQSSDCYQTRPSAQAGRSRVDLFCWHHLNWCKTSPNL